MFIISLHLFAENKIDGQQSITLHRPFVFFRERPLNDGTDGVEHIISGQMIGDSVKYDSQKPPKLMEE